MDVNFEKTCSSFLLGSFTFSIVTVILSPLLLAPVTLVPNLNCIPCLPRIRWNCLATSPSMPNPPMAFMYSTAVTSAPRRPHTEPSSSPITPAPITIIFLGTFFKLRAPVLDTTVSSSTSIPGNGVTSDPVAIRMFLVFTSSLEPSGLRTVTVFGPVILPCPFFRATLFDLNK
uniref:Uncharacterized protein n=1 Tax=Cacopsylla melanoneura TaxID=428564 RepID=A0A8D9ARP4_9HEMI